MHVCVCSEYANSGNFVDVEKSSYEFGERPTEKRVAAATEEINRNYLECHSSLSTLPANNGSFCCVGRHKLLQYNAPATKINMIIRIIIRDS